MHAQTLQAISLLILITYAESVRRRPIRLRKLTGSRGGTVLSNHPEHDIFKRFFCRHQRCEEGKYCNQWYMCLPAKFDGEFCIENKQCLSGVCVENVCKGCRNDLDCPSKGTRDERLLSIIETSKVYCRNNNCVECTKEEHCNLGKVCTGDNKCEHCDTAEGCEDTNEVESK
ncbi:unnamed protein product [Owenia fusiformis]|uniref:Uncharacterized protein n=1 Tax=Owenia fusiformis TaxID=6347 RepID=A0A8J1UCL3_OWEFU|nr:unnamed protein product [Owenia fusiformis]